MKTTFKKRNNLSRQTQEQFGQSVYPTVISQAQFNSMFSFNRSIGQGTFGAVKCVQNCYGENFAIKESKDNDQTYGVFRQAAIMKKFNHPNILKFIAFYEIKQTQKLIILTQFCKFKSLKDFSPFLSSLPEQQKYRLVVEIFSGLYAMHEKNIMHRDLKPQNILIDENKHAKICDFGFCRYDESEDFSKSRRIGTPLYNSPETQKGVYTKKCDVFSYGLIVYFIFSNGKHLFKRTTTNEQLKSQRKQHFRDGKKSYKQLQFPNDIIQLLENTITEKQQKRMDTKQIKVFWHKILRQKKMTNLINNMQESEMINNYEPFYRLDEKQSSTNSILTNQQKLASQLIKYNSQNNIELEASQKFISLQESFKQIPALMKLFKFSIEEVELSKVEKQLIAYGFLYQLELKLECVFSQFNRLNYVAKDLHNPCLNECMQCLFGQMIKKKQQLCSTIVKIGNYLQTIKYLLKPFELLNPITKSFDQLKKLQDFLKDACNKEKIENLKKIEQIQNNHDLYQVIYVKYKPNIDQIVFSKDFAQIMTKYINAIPKDNKQNERQKISTLFEKLSKL